MSERDIFLAALDIPDPAQRAVYLDQACGGDAPLRARVEGLLNAHEAAGSFLGLPPSSAEEAPGDGPTRSHGPGHDNDTTDLLACLTAPGRPGSLGRIGHYEVLEVLGRGGFGVVFRAFDEVLQRVVAVKVLAPSLATTSPARKRFLREARSSAAVRHENVVQVHAVEEQPHPHLVMEFVPGETLQHRLDRTGPLDVTEVLHIGRQVADGLAAAHATGLIHRDIKPSNILIDAGPQRLVKITDFGLARAADDASLTRSGVIAGTPLYMAPEQAKGETLGQRADLFSLGSVLYALLTGRPPFRAETTLGVLKRVAEDSPRPIRDVIPEVPEWLCRVIEKLHAKQPEGRFPSAREVADLLADCERQLLAHGTLRDYSRIPGGQPRRRRPRVAAWAAAGLVAVLALALSLAWWGRETGLRRPASDRLLPAESREGGPAGHVAGEGPPEVAPGPFVLLGPDGAAEQSFFTLADAVKVAQPGAVVEVRGRGPFVMFGVSFDRPLTLRAGAGFQPVLEHDPRDGLNLHFLTSSSALRLEGLSLVCTARGGRRQVVSVTNAPLLAAGCRFVSAEGLCRTVSSPRVEVRNCELVSTWSMASGVAWNVPPSMGVMRMKNCVSPNWGLFLWPDPGMTGTAEIEFADNTFVGDYLLSCYTGGEPLGDGKRSRPFRLSATNNLLQSRSVLRVELNPSKVTVAEWPAERSARLAAALFDWTGRGNVYLPSTGYELWHADQGGKLVRSFKGPDEWKKIRGGGDVGGRELEVGLSEPVRKKLASAPRQLTAADFALGADSPARGKGEGGRDPGASVDLVGPGPAYERWKATPDYRAWNDLAARMMEGSGR